MFLFFLLIASVAWFINRLSNDYHTQLYLNVCIYNSQNEKTPRLCSTEPVAVMARTKGFNILSQRISKPPMVYVDIKGLKVSKADSRFYMLASTLRNNIDQLLSDEMKIESYVKDTIFFQRMKESEIPAEGVVYGTGDFMQAQGNENK